MIFNLFFENSGDNIELTSDNSRLIEYYVQSLNKTNKNNFDISSKNLLADVNYMHECIVQINELFVSKFSYINFSEFVDINLYDHEVLNKIHMTWVKFQIQNPKIATLLFKINPELLTKFRDINHLIHKIEHAKFKICNFVSFDMWSCENIFGSKIIDFNSYNIRIAFNNLGRSTYDKWINYDNNTYDSDTNDFTLLSGELILSTNKAFKQSAPIDYLSFCYENKLPIIGNTIGLGNFTQPISNVQDILYRNLKNGSNNISIQI